MGSLIWLKNACAVKLNSVNRQFHIVKRLKHGDVLDRNRLREGEGWR